LLVNVGKHRNGIIAVDGDTYEDSSALPASIQYGRSASHTLRIVCPNGHLGFAPIKTGRFRIGCDCEPDLICADSGSCDVGPVPLGADISSSPRQSQVDDLEEYCSPLMPEIVADSPSSPVIACFPSPEFKDLNGLLLISFSWRAGSFEASRSGQIQWVGPATYT
jgi:hypothetical protein